MALTKEVLISQLEIIESGVVQIRTSTRIMDNGKILSETYHRKCIAPGDDYSTEDAKVQAVCRLIHTPEVIAAYLAAAHAEGLIGR